MVMSRVYPGQVFLDGVMPSIWLLTLHDVVEVEVPIPESFWVLSEESKSQDLRWVIHTCIRLCPKTTCATEGWDAASR